MIDENTCWWSHGAWLSSDASLWLCTSSIVFHVVVACTWSFRPGCLCHYLFFKGVYVVIGVHFKCIGDINFGCHDSCVSDLYCYWQYNHSWCSCGTWIFEFVDVALQNCFSLSKFCVVTGELFGILCPIDGNLTYGVAVFLSSLALNSCCPMCFRLFLSVLSTYR